MLRSLKVIAIILLAAAAGGAGYLYYLHRRALPLIEGTVATTGVAQPVEIVRDRWGVPHIFAETEQDGYYALGWATAQDRLFHIGMLNQAVQGRLSEWFGEAAVEVDRIFRTLDFQGVGKRLYGRASPEARAALDAYQKGVNDYAQSIGSSLPVEFAVLRTRFRPLEPGDLVGVLGFMSWALHDAWRFEPLFEKLCARIGENRARELFPLARGGSPATHETAKLEPELFRLSPRSEALLDLLPRFPASNNWAIAPSRSATGQALLANDPHLAHGHPPIWYQAHLKAGQLDITGVTIPGLPLIVIGHNRDVAWGFTNLMVDAGDYFVERVNPSNSDQVWHNGAWVDLQVRQEVIQVRGRDPVELPIRISPHGPIVSDLAGKPRPEGLPPSPDEPAETRALAYQWLYWVAEGDMDAFFRLNRARNWNEFREAARGFGAVTQNVAYADREGHIAMQTIGQVPRRKGNPDGTRYREGDGSQDWDGFVPFEQLPFTLDPSQGWVASANNPPLPEPAPFYLATHYEPADRIARIRELLKAKEKYSPDDLAAMQADTVWVSAVRLRPLVLQAFAGQPEPSGDLREALDLLRNWDADMRADSAAAAVFAMFFERLFPAIFADELGESLVRELRAFQNVNISMIANVLDRGLDSWFDRLNTPEREDRSVILREALTQAVADLSQRLGAGPKDWTWGKLHQLEFVHPIGRLALFAPYFNVGPFPVPGHAATVNKMQFRPDNWRVQIGASMRQVTDFADLDRSTGVLPTGQSGIPASPHYRDLAPLWLNGRAHPLLMDRAKIDEAAEATLRLVPK